MDNEKIKELAEKAIKEGKPYDFVKDEEGKHKGLLQQMTCSCEDADEQCNTLNDTDVMCEVSLRTSKGIIRMRATVPGEKTPVSPYKMLSIMAGTLEQHISTEAQNARAFKAGYDAGKKAAAAPTVSENGEEA